MKILDFLNSKIIPICAVEYHTPDRNKVLIDIVKSNNLEVYYWNVGYKSFKHLKVENNCLEMEDTGVEVGWEDVLEVAFNNCELQGVLIIDGCFGVDGSLDAKSSSLVSNLFFREFDASLGEERRNYWILMDTFISINSELKSLVELIDYPLPGLAEVKAEVGALLEKQGVKNNSNFDEVVTACRGLSKGAIEIGLSMQLRCCAGDFGAVAQNMLEYKKAKLRGMGLEYMSEPEVDNAGGLDLLDEYLSDLVKLSKPEAEQYGLRLPKGMLLWGPPGTGKSLSAKLAASKLGYVLMTVSWGNVLGSDRPDRLLGEILEVADNLGGCVLFFDDFDKGFSGWDSNADGGLSRRLSQKLLTWMQEHISPVLMLATVNRLEALPAELIRRFDDGGVWFVDLPHNGARYEIFNLYLKKYFPGLYESGSCPWSDREWYRLISEYSGATGAEIANAVKAVAQRAFVEGRPGEVNVEDLLYQRSKFVLSSERNSEQILAIRNKASFAKPSSSPDSSIFARKNVTLFEYEPHELEKSGEDGLG